MSAWLKFAEKIVIPASVISAREEIEVGPSAKIC
jgi:hypothetical protein